MERRFQIWGLLFGLTAVIIGAFGAHALKEVLTEVQLASFETGIRYQMYHAILLLFISLKPNFQNKLILNLAVIGVFLFSFSIYFLNLRQMLDLEFLSFLGPVTPIGGLLLISTWSILLIKVVQSKT